tara:strand:+ start:1596 stop:2234 length:639 start_codon:yes stop_codon:yes gene_type:complete
MAQHDYNIANQTASSARTDINNALSAIVSNNSGTSAPTTTFANMTWYNTTNNILQIRNEGNTAWITLGTVDQGGSKFEPNQTIATQAEAEAGTNNTKMMTPLRVEQAISYHTTAPNYATSGTSITHQAVFQAPSDGVIVVNPYGVYRNGIQYYCGTSNPPTVLVMEIFDDINLNTKCYSGTIPIKAGTYFKSTPKAGYDAYENPRATFWPNV